MLQIRNIKSYRMGRKLYIIAVILMLFVGFNANSQQSKKNQIREEPAIAVMYAHPELAEEFARTTVKEFAPDPESLKITYCKAQYIPLYRAYVVNCHFNTQDTYGDMQSYKIQMQIQVLPDGQGGVKYNALDFKELR